MSEQEYDGQPVCKCCKEKKPDPSYPFPLCQQCRYLLINRPFPNWIKFVMVVVVGLILYSGFKFPIAFKAGVAQSVGKKAEATSDYSSAILEYNKILSLFPKSEEHKARLAICYIRSGKVQHAADIIKNINE